MSDPIEKEHPMQILGRSLVEQSGLKQERGGGETIEDISDPNGPAYCSK